MKSPTKMNMEQLSNNMDRTIHTLQTTHKNDSLDNDRVQIRAKRFDDLKEVFVECGYWILYCSFNDIDPNSDGFDFVGGE